MGVIYLAYRVLYSPENNKRYPQYKSGHRLHFGLVMIVLASVLGITWIRCKGIPDFLIPGDNAITVEAMKQMLESIRMGTSVDAAVTTFCKDIIYGAGL